MTSADIEKVIGRRANGFPHAGSGFARRPSGSWWLARGYGRANHFPTVTGHRRQDSRMTFVRRTLVLVTVVGVVAVLGATGAAAAERGAWSARLLLSTTSRFSDPGLTADRNGGLHVFWTMPLASSSNKSSVIALDYARRFQGVWSKPTDVYAAPSVNSPTGVVDPGGRLHLFWQQSNGILYTQSAPVEGASSAATWSLVEPFAQTNRSSAIVAEPSGALDLAYPAWQSAGVVFERSIDGGHTWSFPTTVSPAQKGSSADFTRLAVGPDGTIHVVWTEYQLPNGWPPSGLFYARSLDHGGTWSDPVEVAGPGFNQANVIAGPNGLVHVAWNGVAGVQGRYDRWSTDNGKTWSDAASLLVPLGGSLDVGGSTGPPALAIDGAGDVHLLFEEGNRVWHSQWKDGQWSAPDYVPSGDETGLPPQTDGISSKVRHIEQSVMAISQGNELNVLFWDERPGINRLWCVTTSLDAPALPLRPFAAPTVAPTPTTASTATPIDPINPEDSGLVGPPPVPVDTRLLTMLTLLPILGLVVGAISVRIWLANR